jgi:hypothetical protein
MAFLPSHPAQSSAALSPVPTGKIDDNEAILVFRFNRFLETNPFTNPFPEGSAAPDSAAWK